MIAAIAVLLAAGASLPPVDDIVSHFVAAEKTRSELLRNYTATRRYVLVNYRFNKRAELVARVNYAHPGSKHFEVLSEDGNSFIRSRVLHKAVEAEEEASQAALRDASRILPQNYTFRLIGEETVDGRRCYVLELTPRTDNKFLIRGKVWVDAAEYAIVRVEGSPAKNPSMWIRGTNIVYRYVKQGDFWLPQSNRSSSDVRIFGQTDLTIETTDYRVTAASGGTGAVRAAP